MRHAAHEKGVLTPEGRSDVDAVANRFAEWLHAFPHVISFRFHEDAPEVVATAQVLRHATNAGATRLSAQYSDGSTKRLDAYSFDFGAFKDLSVDLSKDAAPGRPKPADRRGRQQKPEEAAENALNSQDEAAEGDEPPSRKAFLFVGNDPLVSRLVDELTGRTFGVQRGELVCLRRSEPPGWSSHWRLAWTISPSDSALLAPVLAKVDAKMTTAKVLGTVTTGLLVFLLTNLLRSDPGSLDWLAFTMLSAASLLYFVTLFHLDTLSMPSAFWGEKAPKGSFRRGKRHNDRLLDLRPLPWLSRLVNRLVASVRRLIRSTRPAIVERPPSSNARVVQESMVATWTRVFLPACLLVAVGVILLAAAAVDTDEGPAAYESEHNHPDHAHNNESDTTSPSRPGGRVAVSFFAVNATAAVWAFRQRPRLGSSD